MILRKRHATYCTTERKKVIAVGNIQVFKVNGIEKRSEVGKTGRVVQSRKY